MSNTTPQYQPLAELVAWVRERTGVGGTVSGRTRLEAAAVRRMESLGLEYASDYLVYLKQDADEWAQFMAGAVNGKTGFFRNPAQFQILPELLADLGLRRSERRLNILSVGCSTGEEVYSLAMTVADSGLPHKGWQVDIYGTDLNTHAVSAARLGQYSAAIRTEVPATFLGRWFGPKGRSFIIRDDFRAKVKLAVWNLLNPSEFPWSELSGQVDLLVCKNVVVDLAPEAGPAVVAILRDLLAPDGILLLAPVEGLLADSTDLIPQRWGGVICYRRLARRFKANVSHVPKRAGRQSSVRQAKSPAASKPRPGLPREIRQALKNGIKALNDQQPDLAWACWEQALDQAALRGDLSAEALGLAGRTGLLAGQTALARDLARRIIDFIGDRPWAHLLLAETLDRDGRQEEATEARNRAEELTAADPGWRDEPLVTDMLKEYS